MTKDYFAMELIEDLEKIVGNHYHNQQKRGGFYFRYPVNYNKNGTSYKATGKMSGLAPENLHSVKYTTGANSLHIGDALFAVLNYLENRYDIDFDELEYHHQNPLSDDLFF